MVSNPTRLLHHPGPPVWSVHLRDTDARDDPRYVQGPGALSLALKQRDDWMDTSIFFRDTIGCLKPCLIMMETGPGCFECDIREDEMSHSNLALDKVSCSKSLENSGHDLALCWFITADHLKFIHRPLIQNGKAFVKITSFKQTAINFSRSQGAQDFITQNDIYKLLSWHYLLSNHCKCVPC